MEETVSVVEHIGTQLLYCFFFFWEKLPYC